MPGQTMTQEKTKPAAAPERPLCFWDIESLRNIFMFAFWFPGAAMLSQDASDPDDHLIFFHLMDDIEMDDRLKAVLTDRVFRENRTLDPKRTRVSYMDLKQEAVNRFLLNWFAVDDKRAFGDPLENRFRRLNPVLRSDLDEDRLFPYMVGYNTQNYDNVMMAAYFSETWGFAPGTGEPQFIPTTASAMRDFNNLLFARYKEDMRKALSENEKNIYENTLRSGLYVDAAKVNDKVYKMPLKRIMGMMGMDIFEDDVVKGDEPVYGDEKLGRLFAYNASDDVKLSRLFRHRAYSAQFQLKKGLLDAYPDIIWKSEKGRRSVRINRMKCDDTSAKFAQRVLCPDGWLKDMRAVSFEYPKGSGRNVLKETREWAERQFANAPWVLTDYLNPIFDWYGAIEGKNFDNSEHYEQAYLLDGLPPSRIEDIPMPQTAVPYFNADGTPSRTYVNFGIGGIHGAEYNQDMYLMDLDDYKTRLADIKRVLDHFPSESDLLALKPKFQIDGVWYKRSDYVTITKDKKVKVKYPKPVELFTKDKKSGKWNLNKKYVWCSDDEVDHQDFTSYYPCMLMNLKAYENEALGEDRYVQQFNNKGLFGKYMKDKARPESEQKFYATMREGTKLILNSASGASDTAYDNPIRMNNVIISMRLLGQMFTWRIGQAETIAGYKVTSTNTDGLYAACNDETRPRLREILAKEAADINVGIEPEAMRLISKDANNRIEISLDGKLLSASGGDTACCDGPVPNKALSHPALIDRLLVDYMMAYGVAEPFRLERGIEVLEKLKASKKPFDLLMLYQQIINSSEGSVRYIFGLMDGKVQCYQHNNRIFAIRQPGAHLYMANGCAQGSAHDDTADAVLKAYGVDPAGYPCTRVIKISRIDPEQNMFIYNRALDELDDASAKGIIDNLDDGYYVNMLEKAYSNWCNAGAHDGPEDGEDAA